MPPNDGVLPECTIIAGPNGAGKSSLFKHLQLPGKFVNADDIARQLDPGDPGSMSFQAGRLVLKTIEEIISRREGFIYETTLSSHHSLNLLRRVREEGYRTLLIFIILETADLHVARVAQRFQLGGHNVPEPLVRRRYELALANLSSARPFCDAVLIYDNSGPDGYRELLEISDGIFGVNSLDPARHLDTRIAHTVADGLQMPIKRLLHRKF